METRRLILVIIFTLSSFLLWQKWEAYNQPQTQAAAASGKPASAGDVPQPSAPLAAASGSPAPTAPNAAPAGVSAGETFTVDTDLVKATFSTQGGDLIGLELLKYRAHGDKTRHFVLLEPKHSYLTQSGLVGEHLPSHRTVFKRVVGPGELADGANELRVRFEASGPDGVKIAKVYTLKRGSYAIELAWEIENGSAKALASHAYFQVQRDDVSPEGETKMVSTFTGPAVFTEAEKYQKVEFSAALEGKAKFAKTADNGWLAMVQHYFVTAWVPAEKTPREFYMRKAEGSANVVQAGVILPLAEVAPGGKGGISVTLFAGPQIQDALKKIAPGLDLVVDYGWLTVVAAPIFWALEAIHKLVGNWGWAIVILTVLIKAAFYPLSAASYKSMAKMRVLTPRLMQLKERYSDDRQRLNQEMMKLYQTEKVNPLGGCLPILVQIPVFIALYWVLLGAVEMRDAPWVLWITDLASQDPYYILPVVMVVTMLIQTKLNPTPPDPMQAKVMMAMPFIFGVMFFWFPAGLVLYWVVNNILSIAQQWRITQVIEAGGKAANDAKA